MDLLRKLFSRTSSSSPRTGTTLEALLEREGDFWSLARQRAAKGKRILLATSVGGHKPVVVLDQLLGAALTAAGASVDYLLCDGVLPGCERCVISQFRDVSEFIGEGPAKLCKACFGHGRAAYEKLGLRVHSYSSLLTGEELTWAGHTALSVPVREIGQWKLDALAVGEHATAGALRFFARGTLDSSPETEKVLRRYFEAAILTVLAVRRLFASTRYECASFHHGIYVPQGLVGEVCREANVRVANWQVAYRKRRFIFSHGDTYHHTMLEEPVEKWQIVSWGPRLEEATMVYLKSRWQGSRDWIYFHENPKEDLAELQKEIGIQFDKPTIGLLTNVIWDAQLHYRTNAFSNMVEWVTFTIDYFRERADLQLVIRIHPAEIRGTIPSRQLMREEIEARFPELPKNVFVVGPEQDVSTYALMMQCDCAIIYGTKTGVELSSMGIPVIVAGEAWIRNKGLTLDADSPEAYRGILDTLPLGRRLDEKTTRLARMYAFHFFFRRMIPVECVYPVEGPVPYETKVRSFDDLALDRCPGLATICRGILNGADFIYPAENISLEETETAV